MTRRLALFLALTAFVGCAHAKKEEKHATASSAELHREATEMPPAAPGRPPLAASPDALFVEGGVKQIQQALEKRGLLHGEASGTLDPETKRAVIRFQKESGLAETGVPDYETLRKLGLEPEALLRKVSPTPHP